MLRTLTPSRSLLRSPARRRRARGQSVSSGTSLPPPVEGWDAVSPISDMGIKRALVLDNWFPTPQGVKVRRGRQVHAFGLSRRVVESLMPYNGVTSASSKLFAATNGKIFDATASGAGVEVVSGLTSNRWQHVNFTTSGGHFLWICNGSDAPRHYNGSAWATPSLTISGHSSDEIINANAHKNRIFVIFKDSLDAGYLPTGSIAGTITVLPLGGFMTKGGYLVAMATWTRDGGAGSDDLAVFISSEGQCAVFAGTDPASSTTWELVGVYDIGAPIGYRCFAKVGGDLALVNLDGVVPLSEALSKDRGASATFAITARINNAMNAAARDYKSNFGWQLVPYPRGTQVLLNVPVQEGQTQQQYVMNTLTGAWCRYTNWNGGCFAVFRDQLYMGGNDGYVWRCDQTGLDGNQQIDAVGQCAYSYYKMRGARKQFKLVRPILTSDSSLRPALGISTDFRDNAILNTAGVVEAAGAKFDQAVFDRDVFPVESRTVADWASVEGEGYCGSIHFRARTGANTVSIWGISEWEEDPWFASTLDDVDLILNGFDMVYEVVEPGASL